LGLISKVRANRERLRLLKTFAQNQLLQCNNIGLGTESLATAVAASRATGVAPRISRCAVEV
jgi:hypothetical protein